MRECQKFNITMATGEAVIPSDALGQIAAGGPNAKSGQPAATLDVGDLIEPLLALYINAHALVLAELRRLVCIPLKRWPFPKGFQTRVARRNLTVSQK